MTSRREAHLKEALGDDLYARVKRSRLLVVGAGGIGCELLKNLVLAGFDDIDIIDLDTIDVSNLNRQFLFRKHHVGQPKSTVAKESVASFSPHTRIQAHLGNIMEPRFACRYFSQFDVVLNALDNAKARSYVNSICIATERPLIESGTTGFKGQVRVIGGDVECYECQVQTNTEQTFAVCTIRSTPDRPEHCVQWAKYLYELMFGDPNDDNLLADLKHELKQEEHSDHNGKLVADRFAENIFNKLFKKDIEQNRELQDMAKNFFRPPPIPLSLDGAMRLTDGNGNIHGANGNASSSSSTTNAGTPAAIAEQKVWSVHECAQKFIGAITTMYNERGDEVGTLQFSKEDPIAVDFVAAASNLRSHNFHIAKKSRWDVQSIAGRIVPAIATTNAIVAGLQTVNLYHVLEQVMLQEKKEEKQAANGTTHTNGVAPHSDDKRSGTQQISLINSKCRNAWLQLWDSKQSKLVIGERLSAPRPDCVACSSPPARVTITDMDWTIGDFVATVIQGALQVKEPVVYFNNDPIWQHQYDDEEDDMDDDNCPEMSLSGRGLYDGCIIDINDLSDWTPVEPTDDNPMGKEYKSFNCVVFADVSVGSCPKGFRIDRPPKFKPPPPTPAPPAAENGSTPTGGVKRPRDEANGEASGLPAAKKGKSDSASSSAAAAAGGGVGEGGESVHDAIMIDDDGDHSYKAAVPAKPHQGEGDTVADAMVVDD
ncbi:unnamed protein product [Vitrella brassicaformis CCMP3155]|uniref:SUMO-activating enzyme subunit n=1 Tax=Vitrella brassicaformis (strain CCMP3155) TaxID=1169540 RepID=A0A0G4EFX0_VITBC|nr:unnamed protein product [Vitrella brassicaformis CCMP3155]|eukprot:CEL94275.1 unnamed protein product [Vitrella brassicaformis CCMP3155]